jgi:hypothetical protein
MSHKRYAIGLACLVPALALVLVLFSVRHGRASSGFRPPAPRASANSVCFTAIIHSSA